jgi:hypothetical protein
MAKRRTTVTLDVDVLRAVRIKAARTGKQDSQVIEESLRRDLGLEGAENVWARVKPMSEGESLKLADAEIHAMRAQRHAAGGA